jgi:hypothetical protein
MKFLSVAVIMTIGLASAAPIVVNERLDETLIDEISDLGY